MSRIVRSPRVFVALLVVLIALLPAAALAQGRDATADRQFTLKINGDERVGATDRVGSVVVIRGNAIVEGTVQDALIVIDGDATVRGTVEGDVVIANGTLSLAAGSSVRNVSMYRADIQRAAGATVTGAIHERPDVTFGWVPVVFGFVMWAGSTIALLAAAALFAAIGGGQLRAATVEMTDRAGASILAAVVLFIGVPIAAVAAIVTLIGAPVGIGVLLFVLPAAAFAGYLTFGTLLGALVLRTTHVEGGHPYREALLGVAIAQLFALLPLGGFALLFIAAWGAGGLGLVAWRAAGGRSGRAVAPAAPAAVHGA